jgi:predicted acylesterase/phospholipase RssA
MILQAGVNPGWFRQADLVIQPKLADFSPQDMSKKEKIIAAGEQAMKESLTKLPHRSLLN